jgi:S-adenosylmethionine/arginine decarboxylase-like enzyme
MHEHGLSAGKHIVLDAFVKDNQILSDISKMSDILIKLVGILKMEILLYPQFLYVPTDTTKLNTDADDGGISGFCMVTTSHISIHTWPLRNRFSMDVFSCKDFSEKEAMGFLRKEFGIESETIKIIDRKWPVDIISI